MKGKFKRFSLVAFVGLTLAGVVFTRRSGPTVVTAEGSRKILYYVDPMNPSHTSPQPGFAPCGMKLEPVYADSEPRHSQPGEVSVPAGRQSLIGLKTSVVRTAALKRRLRWPARVAIDQSRVHQVVAPLDGRITATVPVAVGSLVQRDDVLASYYSPEFLHPAQVLVYALNAEEQLRSNKHSLVFHDPQPQSAYTDKLPEYTYTDQLAMFARTGQLSQSQMTIKLNLDSLRNLGMGTQQMERLIQERKPLDNINLCSPASGLVLFRNASVGQMVMKGTELFKVADVSRLWVVANIPPGESSHLAAGQPALVHGFHNGATLKATVSAALPEYDEVSRATLVRFEVENPNLALKPGMPVDVEMELASEPGLLVAADAVVDSGERRLVYVQTAPGAFSPREVRTGSTADGWVEVSEGLNPGETVAASGNFLIDSESRIKLAGSAPKPETLDMVCKMSVDEAEARQDGLIFEYQGRSFLFCNPGCREKFKAAPARYLDASAAEVSALPSAPRPDLMSSLPVSASPINHSAHDQSGH